MAFSTIGSAITGVVKIRFSWLNVHSS